MVDFRDKLRRGLVAHQEASTAKAEIRGVVDDLSEAVSQETSSMIGIKLKYIAPPFSFKAKAVAELAAGISSREAVPYEQWLIAYAKNTVRVPEQKLAEFQISVTGYPCTLRFGGERLDAYDKEGLEIGLGSLLENPETGKAIEILKREIPLAKAPPPPE